MHTIFKSFVLSALLFAYPAKSKIKSSLPRQAKTENPKVTFTKIAKFTVIGVLGSGALLYLLNSTQKLDKPGGTQLQVTSKAPIKRGDHQVTTSNLRKAGLKPLPNKQDKITQPAPDVKEDAKRVVPQPPNDQLYKANQQKAPVKKEHAQVQVLDLEDYDEASLLAYALELSMMEYEATRAFKPKSKIYPEVKYISVTKYDGFFVNKKGDIWLASNDKAQTLGDSNPSATNKCTICLDTRNELNKEGANLFHFCTCANTMCAGCALRSISTTRISDNLQHEVQPQNLTDLQDEALQEAINNSLSEVGTEQKHSHLTCPACRTRYTNQALEMIKYLNQNNHYASFQKEFDEVVK
ncbi:MAG: hypothetical protein AAF380_01295 [Bacteroidota bacterium]